MVTFQSFSQSHNYLFMNRSILAGLHQDTLSMIFNLNHNLNTCLDFIFLMNNFEIMPTSYAIRCRPTCCRHFVAWKNSTNTPSPWSRHYHNNRGSNGLLYKEKMSFVFLFEVTQIFTTTSYHGELPILCASCSYKINTYLQNVGR